MSYHNHLQIKSLPDQFEHTALDFRARSIRLVQLHRERSGHELLECTIRAASTDSHYVCLSYVWGEPGQGRAILLNGHRYWVRQNLWNFLHAARQNTEVRRRWIWIDALCIDQNNVAERQHQVQQMGLIYSNAAEVYTWLGNDDLISRFLAMGKGYDSVRYNRSSEPVLSIAGENVLALCSSPYWRRAWTTQEFALARQVTL
ncbi:HET-domain-containing protein, partial [Ophiobolus disseminans]